MPDHTPRRLWWATCLPLVLAACATQAPPPQVDAPTPTAWQAPLPHQGSVQALGDWWAQWGDPLLVELVQDAQALSPDLAQAQSRIVQARAALTGSRAALTPSVDAQASASRGFNESVRALATTAQAGLQGQWEIDLWGGNAAAERAASERLQGAQAQWHAARVSVAAEVALQYSSLRTCLQQQAIAEDDERSRAQTARLSQQSERAGFTAPATHALAQASAAEAVVRSAQQRMQCALELKALVALTGRDEATLRTRLAPTPLQPPTDALLRIATLPAQVIAQRPDVYAAEREVAAASADVGQAQAQRYPRLALSGTIGAAQVRTQGLQTDLNTWSLGPLALSLPLLDGGRRAAQEDAARARYDETVALYRARVRLAVSEVEQALVRLDASVGRTASAQAAAEGYRTAFRATEARWRAGLASQLELEDARRTALAADQSLALLAHERAGAWVALYRAAGGGWQAPVAITTAQH